MAEQVKKKPAAKQHTDHAEHKTYSEVMKEKLAERMKIKITKK